MTSISPVESSSPISHRSTRPKSPLRTKNQQEDTLTRTAVTTKTATWADFDPGESGVGDDIDGCDEEVITSDLEDLDEIFLAGVGPVSSSRDSPASMSTRLTRS
ncbi:unnamed protein product, partial [Ascophyllum nodosum]